MKKIFLVLASLLVLAVGSCNQPIDFSKKTFSVFGDSISTFKGYIPDNYNCHYDSTMMNVEDTWWMQLAGISGMKYSSNASWSGSTVASGVWSPESAFVAEGRMDQLAAAGVPDYIIILGGTNDWGWRRTPLGEFPEEGKEINTEEFRGAYTYMVKRLKEKYPETIIVCCTPLPRTGADDPEEIAKRGWTLDDADQTIKAVAEKYGAMYVDMSDCGIAEDFEGTTLDGLHPNAAGMKLVAQRMWKSIKGE